MDGLGVDRADDRAAVLLSEVGAAARVLGDPHAWVLDPGNARTPVAVECWIFDRDLERVVLVRHRWRGWVAPGGAVEDGEAPRVAAQRELEEETGLTVELSARPIVACLRSYRADWEPTLAFTFAGQCEPQELRAEAGQPCRWAPLAQPWSSTFPDDRARMLELIAGRTSRVLGTA